MGAPLRVLIVEDSKDDMLLLLQELRQGGYEPVHERVETPEDMRAALDRQPWEIILSDYYMPRFNALSALKILKESGLDLPFIVVSGSIGEETAVAAMKAGVHDYLMKDKLARLVPAIERELREAQMRRTRSQAEQALQFSINRWHTTFNAISDSVCLLDPSGRILQCNKAMEVFLGKPAEDIIGHACWELIHGASKPIEGCPVVRMKESSKKESLVIRADHRWFHVSADPVFDDQGRLSGAVHTLSDVTEQKQGEEKLARINRLYSVLSGINEAIVRIKKPVELFKQVCKISIEQGCFRMAWIGLLDEGGALVLPVASWGVEDGYLKAISISADGAPESRGPSGTAIQEGRYDVCHDFQRDPRVEPWRAEATKRGYRSSAAFPLKKGTRVFGVVNFYASEPNWFNQDEVQLLEALAADVSFAVESLEREEQRKLATEALAASEERFRTAFDNAAVGMSLTGVDGRLLRVNEAMCSMMGYSAQELHAMTFAAITHPDDLAESLECIRLLLAGNRDTYNMDKRYVRKDGHTVWASVSTSLLRDAGGTPLYFITQIVNITNRKVAEEALKESEERFRQLVENSLVGILIVQEHRIVYMNPEQEKFSGSGLLRVGEPVDFGRIHPEDVQQLRQLYEDLLAGKIRAGDVQFRLSPPENAKDRRGGRALWVHCRASAIEYMGKPALLANMMDITRLKEMEYLLRIEDKMTSLGRIAAGMAHELRNPVSGINIYVSNLERVCRSFDNLEPKALGKIETIIEQLRYASEKVESVVRRVMDFARPGTHKIAPIDINSCIREVLELSSTTLRKSDVEIVELLAPDLPQCYADAHLIGQVLMNLITNAHQSMKDMEGRKVVEIVSRVEGHSLLVTVSDSGSGVPQDMQDKVFDPFFTTKKEGLGIGLSICHRVISDHGGSLTLGTSEWGGAEFTIKIPVRSGN